jgi:hypothetical protein
VLPWGTSLNWIVQAVGIGLVVGEVVGPLVKVELAVEIEVTVGVMIAVVVALGVALGVTQGARLKLSSRPDEIVPYVLHSYWVNASFGPS